jgi:hypothetical protein
VPKINLLLAKESAVNQGEKIFGLQLCLLPFLRGLGRGEDGGDDND